MEKTRIFTLAIASYTEYLYPGLYVHVTPGLGIVTNTCNLRLAKSTRCQPVFLVLMALLHGDK